MADARPSIAVVGAAGFVGRRLLRALEEAGIPALAGVRNPPELSIDGAFHTPVRLDRAGDLPRCETVINLAYPTSGSPVTHAAQNADIAKTVDSLLKDGGRVIHVSTQAVFGLALERPVTAGPAPAARDEPYVEAKLDAEQRFASRHKSLDIVRLGNVWGPASSAWALPLVQRLVTGRPVGVRGRRGFSNVTDVANVASFLLYLVRSDTPDAPRYHHLAEFSSAPWERFVDPLAHALDVEPVLAEPDALEASDTLSDELGRALASLRPRTIYKALASERLAGSWVRSVMRSLPAGVFEQLRGDRLVFAGEQRPDRSEETFLAVMTAQREFTTNVVSGWTPPVDEAESLRRVVAWVQAG